MQDSVRRDKPVLFILLRQSRNRSNNSCLSFYSYLLILNFVNRTWNRKLDMFFFLAYTFHVWLFYSNGCLSRSLQFLLTVFFRVLIKCTQELFEFSASPRNVWNECHRKCRFETWNRIILGDLGDDEYDRS